MTSWQIMNLCRTSQAAHSLQLRKTLPLAWSLCQLQSLMTRSQKRPKLSPTTQRITTLTHHQV
eukprot:8760798-Prorocentrum_lima.AAC.1